MEFYCGSIELILLDDNELDFEIGEDYKLTILYLSLFYF